MKFLPRTDLASEDLESNKKSIDEYEENGVKVQKIIIGPEESKQYKKKEGTYYSLYSDSIVLLDHDECSNISLCLKKILEDNRKYLTTNLNDIPNLDIKDTNIFYKMLNRW